MLERELSVRSSPDYRYVSPYASRRVLCCFLAFAFVTATAWGEGRQGAVAEVLSDAEIVSEPKPGARSFGVLPRGTLLRISGEEEGLYLPVEVELEQGGLEGWILQDKLSRPGQDVEKKSAVEVAEPTKRPRRRVPKDEELLFRRQPTFFYGLNAGGLYSLINAFDATSYGGFGFSAGGHLGFFLSRTLPLRIEVGYTSLLASDSNGVAVSFGFLDAGASLSYELKEFEFFGKVHYAFGSSVSALPGALASAFGAVSELGGIWVGAGIGYRFPSSNMVRFSTRLGYHVSLGNSVFAFNTFRLSLLLDFEG
jgi:hypothetical protein